MLDTQTLTVADLLDQSKAHDDHKADFKSSVRNFSFDDNARIVPSVEPGLFGSVATSTPLAPTRWAWSQIFSKLGPTVLGGDRSLPSDYLLALRPEQRAALLNDHIQHTSADRTWLVRSFDDNARAVLSGIYTDINNTDLLETLHKVTTETTQPNSLTRDSNVTPDSLNVRIIWKDIDRPRPDGGGNKNWGIGVAVRNGETGNRKGGILPLIKRGSCDNSIVLDDGVHGYEFLHLGNKAAKLALIKGAMIDILPFAAKLLEDMIQADTQLIPDFTDVISGICLQHGWNEDIKIKIAQGTEGQETRAGLVNGVTWVSHFVEDPDTQLDFQIAGGAILVAKDSVFSSAARLARAER